MALKQKILFRRTDLYSWQIGEGGVGNGQTQARLSLTEKGAQYDATSICQVTNAMLQVSQNPKVKLLSR